MNLRERNREERSRERERGVGGKKGRRKAERKRKRERGRQGEKKVNAVSYCNEIISMHHACVIHINSNHRRGMHRTSRLAIEMYKFYKETTCFRRLCISIYLIVGGF